jgi:hypothetical protein
MWPRIVADALDVAPHPPPWRGVDVTCDAGLWHAASREAWEPAIDERPAPGWLRTHQIASWRRSVAALQRYGGAILAEPVGAGKTWIALAAIHALGGRATVVAPAVLLPQWQAAAATLALRVHWHSLERCSRGVPPPDDGGVAVVDEAHRLRHHGTRRVLTMADWLAHRPALLLTATPIVNRRTDLLALLGLVVGDDVLRHDGVPSLEALATADIPHPALRRLVVRTMSEVAGTPLKTRRLPTAPAEHARAARAAEGITSLRLATSPGPRRLLQGVLADAAASSDAAWQAALQRSEALLHQAHEAGGLSREMLRRFAGAACEQGVMWELVAPEAREAPVRLPTEDLPHLRVLRALPSSDEHWLAAVDDLLHDGAVTVLFCRHRATARLLRQHLGDAVGWVTGQEAGIGPHRVARQLVLSAFGPLRAQWQLRQNPPSVLIATDVVAEGLDLHAASRLVHIDLPWTAMRRDQRNGRLRRPGQRADIVDVIERHPPPTLERLLRLGWRIQTKATLATRWLDAIQHGLDQVDLVRVPRTAGAPVERLWLVRVGHGPVARGTILVATGGGAAWVPGPADVMPLLARLTALPTAPRAPDQPTTGREVLAAAYRALAVPGQCPALTARIQRLARSVGHRRDVAGLVALDALLSHLQSPGPLGLRRELERLRHAPDRELLAHRLPHRARLAPPVIRIIASVMVPTGRSPLRSRHDHLLDRTVRSGRDAD